MTREEFKELDILEQIDFINVELNIHKAITKVCKEHDLRRQTIQNWFSKAGYQFNKESNQYTKVYDSIPIDKELHIEEVSPIKKSTTKVNNTNNTNTKDIKYKALEGEIKGLKEHINNIYKLIEDKEYTKVNNSIPTNIIHEDIEQLQGTEIIVRTYKIYADIDKRLQEHISNNKQYKIQDIINSILIDYLDRYNKQDIVYKSK